MEMTSQKHAKTIVPALAARSIRSRSLDLQPATKTEAITALAGRPLTASMKTDAPQYANQSLAAKLAQLPHLSRQQLMALWTEPSGRLPAMALSTHLLRRAIAYAIQERKLGGLKKQDAQLLHKVANAFDLAKVSDELQDSRRAALLENIETLQKSKPILHKALYRPVLRPGTKLVREWQGKSQVVDVREDGFGWNGKVFGSLSKVAVAITGAHWSGPRFFRA